MYNIISSNNRKYQWGYLNEVKKLFCNRNICNKKCQNRNVFYWWTNPPYENRRKILEKYRRHKKHIFQISDGHFCDYYEDCYIVKFKMKPDGSVSESIVCKIVFPHILNC